MAELLALPGRPDLFTASEGLMLTPEDLKGRRKVSGITLDYWNQKDYDGSEPDFDAEQGMSLRLLDRNTVQLQVHLVDPTTFFEKIPQLQDSASNNLRSTFDENGNLIDSMLPDAVMRKLALRPGEERPTITVQVDIDRTTGKWSNPEIFLSRFRSIEAVSYNQAEERLASVSKKRDEQDFSMHLYYRTAAVLGKQLYGTRIATNILKGIRDGEDWNEYPRAALINRNFMMLANMLIAEDCANHATPTLYWNEHKTPEELSKWPQSEIPQRKKKPQNQPSLTIPMLNNLIQIDDPQIEDVPENLPFAHPTNWGNARQGQWIYGRGTSPVRELRSLVPILNTSARLQGKPYFFFRSNLEAMAGKVTRDYAQHLTEKRILKEKEQLMGDLYRSLEAKKGIRPKEFVIAILQPEKLSPDQKIAVMKKYTALNSQDPNNKITFMTMATSLGELAEYRTELSSERKPDTNTWCSRVVLQNGADPIVGTSELPKRTHAETEAYYISLLQLLDLQLQIS